MYIKDRFYLDEDTVETLARMEPAFGYNGFGEVVFYRTYSRTKEDGSQETWHEVVRRVVEGVFTIRKNWYRRNFINWDEGFWQHYARDFAISMFKMHWMPPGRGLWAMGTDYVYERGAMALYNCAASRVGAEIGEDCHWIMDCLMNGVGVGFLPERTDIEIFIPSGPTTMIVIPDSREGWCDSVQILIESYLNPGCRPIDFDYSMIRPAGVPIRGFGGVASGPAPLKQLHERLRTYFSMYLTETWYDEIMLRCDIVNAIGCCVVAGNVRRSAELACRPIDDQTFMNLKNYDLYPHRAEIGWMSNNSVILEEDEDFEKLGEIAERVIRNGEPGYVNYRNLPKGRIGKDDSVRPDAAIMFNPCGEIPLEDKEVCNISESLPTVAKTEQEWLKACEYATVYMSTVSLLPTHRNETNAVVARNRRIGLGIVDYTGWVTERGLHKVVSAMRKGYDIVRETNRWVNGEAGVPEAIRVTTVKPGGTVPKLPGKTSGVSYPTFSFTLRRVRVNRNSSIVPVLRAAGIPSEPCVIQPEATLIFEFPILQGPSKPVGRVSIWEQAINIITLQREWADNAVSNTIYFRPKWQLIRDIKVDETAYVVESGTNFIVKGIPNTDEELGGDHAAVIELDHTYKAEIVEVYGEQRLKIYQYDANHEEDSIEPVLSALAPMTKSISMLPYSGVGVYPQMPESEISEEEYHSRLKAIKPIDWST
jgi:ribonucleoside-triphosphate reductase